jgi:phage repressor protein C with HTH and peptisase S24 domain
MVRQAKAQRIVTHDQIWIALDRLAARAGLSPSGLAKRAGLDPTTFNRSKRTGPDGRERWPSTESIAKILVATGASLDEFMSVVLRRDPAPARTIPLIGFAQAGSGGFFDDGGFPVGTGWEEVAFPGVADEKAYALEISGDSMLPLYRDGDTIIVSPTATVRRGDRVVVKTVEGEVLAKQLRRQTAKTIELASLNPEHADRVLNLAEIAFMARVIWASQ